MATESGLDEASESGGTTRRSALKLGVGAGVGLAAWSGASITSLGGTPVYAAGCTFVINIDLSDGCRNTDQGNCPSGNPLFSYHTLKQTGYPTGYSLANNVPEGTCCQDNWTPVLNFPAGITCRVVVKHAAPPNCTGTVVGSYVAGPSSSGMLAIPLMCVTNGGSYPQNTQYTIIAKCNTTGAPIDCIT